MTTDRIIIELAGAPMGKERVRVTRNGHAFTPERTLNYEARLAYAAQQAMAGRAPLEGPLQVIVQAFMPIPASKPKRWAGAALAAQIRPTKKPDADNIAKMLDAMNLIAWTDDVQVVDLRVLKWFSDRPRLVVEVFPVKFAEGVFQ